MFLGYVYCIDENQEQFSVSVFFPPITKIKECQL